MTTPAQLPNLSNLSVLTAERQPRSALSASERAEDGLYCLDKRDIIDPCRSYIILKRAAIQATPEEFAEAEAFFMNESKTEAKPMYGNKSTRRQCTFGLVQYKDYHLVEPVRWPALVCRTIAATQAFATQLGIPHANEYDSVHGNYYPDEGAGVMAHADDEPQLIPGAPIFSYTFLKDDDNTRARVCDQGQAQEGPHRQDHGRDQGAARVGRPARDGGRHAGRLCARAAQAQGAARGRLRA